MDPECLETHKTLAVIKHDLDGRPKAQDLYDLERRIEQTISTQLGAWSDRVDAKLVERVGLSQAQHATEMEALKRDMLKQSGEIVEAAIKSFQQKQIDIEADRISERKKMAKYAIIAGAVLIAILGMGDPGVVFGQFIKTIF